MCGHSIFVLFNSGLAFTSSKLQIINICVKSESFSVASLTVDCEYSPQRKMISPFSHFYLLVINCKTTFLDILEIQLVYLSCSLKVTKYAICISQMVKREPDSFGARRW